MFILQFFWEFLRRKLSTFSAFCVVDCCFRMSVQFSVAFQMFLCGLDLPPVIGDPRSLASK